MVSDILKCLWPDIKFYCLDTLKQESVAFKLDNKFLNYKGQFQTPDIRNRNIKKINMVCTYCQKLIAADGDYRINLESKNC